MSHYEISGKNLIYWSKQTNSYTGGMSSSSWWREWEGTVKVVQSKTNTSKGTTKYSDVTSTNNSTYPSNGASGSYWYVYKGVY